MIIPHFFKVQSFSINTFRCPISIKIKVIKLFWPSIYLALCLNGNLINAQNIDTSDIGKFKVQIGPSIILVLPKKQNNTTTGYSYSLGFSNEKKIEISNLSLKIGITFSNLKVDKYENTFFDFTYQTEVDLRTQLNQFFIEAPCLLKKKINKCSLGLGLIPSYLVKSKISQEVTSTNYPEWLLESFHATYDINSSKELAPFSRLNISPCVNLEIELTKTIGLEMACSYNLISNPRNYYKIGTYNTFCTSLLITYQIN